MRQILRIPIGVTALSAGGWMLVIELALLATSLIFDDTIHEIPTKPIPHSIEVGTRAVPVMSACILLLLLWLVVAPLSRFIENVILPVLGVLIGVSVLYVTTGIVSVGWFLVILLILATICFTWISRAVAACLIIGVVGLPFLAPLVPLVR